MANLRLHLAAVLVAAATGLAATAATAVEVGDLKGFGTYCSGATRPAATARVSHAWWWTRPALRWS